MALCNSSRAADVKAVGGPGAHFLLGKIQRLMATGQGSAAGSDKGLSAKFTWGPSILSSGTLVSILQLCWSGQIAAFFFTRRRGNMLIDGEERDKESSPIISSFKSTKLPIECSVWTVPYMTKKKFQLTNNDSSDSKDHKGIFYEASFHIPLCDVLHSLLGQQWSGLDPGPDLVETTPGSLRVLPVAVSHSCHWNLQIWYKRARTWTPLNCNGNTLKVLLFLSVTPFLWLVASKCPDWKGRTYCES